MTAEHDALRERLGRVGAWTFAFDARPAGRVRDDVGELEALGYPAIWIPEGSSSRDVFALLSLLLSATSRMTVASGIANITARQPEVMAQGGRTLADAHPGRAVLGIGVGHEYSTESRGIAWGRPLARMRAYLDRMDEAPWGWSPQTPVARLLAALGDGMLRLSADRALGAHSYFVPVAHTAHAREVLGPDPVLAVELTAVLETDAPRAREVARAWAVHYLELPNYARNLLRCGFGEDDVAGSGSDRLVDGTIAWGDIDTISARIREHLDAGADHVCVQFVSSDDTDVCLSAYRELAAAMPAS
jgi:probable F420-dependent oxidoreductase